MTNIIDKLAKALKTPGIDRQVVFRGNSIFSYSAYAGDPTKVVREAADGSKLIGRLVHDEFVPDRALGRTEAFVNPEDWLLTGEAATRIANGYRVTTGVVQAIAKAIHELRPAPAVERGVAEELGWRDMQIDELRRRVADLEAKRDELFAERDKAEQMYRDRGFVLDIVKRSEDEYRKALQSIKEHARPDGVYVMDPSWVMTHVDRALAGQCLECGSSGFKPSVTGTGCTFCDGTEGGHPPEVVVNRALSTAGKETDK